MLTHNVRVLNPLLQSKVHWEFCTMNSDLNDLDILIKDIRAFVHELQFPLFQLRYTLSEMICKGIAYQRYVHVTQ